MSHQIAIESEASLILGVLDRRTDPETQTILSSLDPESFLQVEHRSIWAAFQAIAEGGGIIDAWVLSRTLGKLKAPKSAQELANRYFLDLETQFQTGDLKARVDAVAEAYKRRTLANAMARLAERAFSDDLKTLEVDFQEVAGKMAQAGTPRMRSATDYARQFEAFLSGQPILPPEGRINLSRFGIPGIDGAIVANPGRLMVIGGLPSAGKTAMAIQAAVRTCQEGRRVALGSLEMDEDEISARMVATACGVDSLHALRRGVDASPENRAILEQVRRNIVGIHGFSGDSWTSLEAAIHREHRKSPLSLVVVDYLQLLEAPEIKGRRDTNEAQRIGEITKSAKRLAQRLRCNVLMLSQFNREVQEGQEPSLQHFLGSGQIERDIDIALLLWNTEKNPTGDRRTVMCRIAKNRGGARFGKVRLSFNPAHNLFTEDIRDTDGFTPPPVGRWEEQAELGGGL